MDELVSGAREAAISTHGGSLAIAAAAATAAAVSAAIDGAPADGIFALAEAAAAQAERRWPGAAAPAMANAIRAVHEQLITLPVIRAADVARCCFPDRPLTIVPLAIGLATVMRSAEDAILLAANVGGDSDSVASVAGGILGARDPGTVNQPWCEVVERVNAHNLAALAGELARCRQ